MPEQLLPEQLLPEQLLPEQLLPEQLFPEQLLPEQLLPEQLLPEQLLPEAISQSPLNCPFFISPAGFGGKASHCDLLKLFRNLGSSHALTISSGDNWFLAFALDPAKPKPSITPKRDKNLRRFSMKFPPINI